MNLRRFQLVLLMLALVSCRIVSAGPAQEANKIISIKDFGARGDGVSDDTAAIQTAINAATNGTTIRFPSGTYVVSNFVVKNRSGLSFVGEGRNSLIKQKVGAQRIATFEGIRDVVIAQLAFDANGITSYGGVVFYAAKRVRIENNTFVDSAPKPIGSTDRYSFVFARGSGPSQDIKIVNNVIDDLQLEVDHSQRVIIEGNTVSRAVNTAGIGIFTVGDNAIAEDYLIKGNTVIDPPGSGFNAGIDPPSSRNCVFRRITITDNQVVRTKTAGYGVRIGTPDNSVKTSGNVFENLIITNNRFRIEAGAPRPRQIIFANTSSKAGIVFKRLTVSGNKIENAGLGGRGYAIDLRRIQDSGVTDNDLKGVASGISLSGDLSSNELRNNTVEASDIAYRIEGSLGGNKAVNNRIFGNPQQGWRLANLKTSDSIQK